MVFPIERRNSRWWHAMNAATRLAVLRGATRPFASNVIVNEFPKSGGSWLSQMLSEALDLPYPRNRLPMLGSCLMQCHVLNPAGMRRVVVVWRDGRDVAVSFYHHLLSGHEYADPTGPESIAARLGIADRADIHANLPRFIDAMAAGEVGPSFTWPQFVDGWHGRDGVVETRYEDLLTDAEVELQRIVTSLTGQPCADQRISEIVEKYSFAKQSGRKAGEEKRGSFIRKGIAGDWVNQFSEEAVARFDAFGGPALRKLGYDT